jgi:hypothetical protein
MKQRTITNEEQLMNNPVNDGFIDNKRYIFLGLQDGQERWKYNWNTKPSKYNPHQGYSECERRRTR